MRTLIFLFRAVPVILISVICLSCGDIMRDKCDSYNTSQISVSIAATIHLRGINNFPMKGQRIEVTIYKEPCGLTPKEEVTYTGVTDNEGNFYSGVANYNLRNKADNVTVLATGLDIVIGGAVEKSYEYRTTGYNEFVAGTIKNVVITLHTNQ